MTKFHNKVLQEVTTLDIIKEVKYLIIKNKKDISEKTEGDVIELGEYSVCYSPSIDKKDKFIGKTIKEVLDKVKDNNPDLVIVNVRDNSKSNKGGILNAKKTNNNIN